MIRNLIITLKDSDYFTELFFLIVSLFLVVLELVLFFLYYIFSGFSLISLDFFVSMFDSFSSFNAFLYLIVLQIILTTIALIKFIFNKHGVNKHYWASLILIFVNYIVIFLLLYFFLFRNSMYLDFISIY